MANRLAFRLASFRPALFFISINMKIKCLPSNRFGFGLINLVARKTAAVNDCEAHFGAKHIQKSTLPIDRGRRK